MTSKQNKTLYLNLQKLKSHLQERKLLINPFKDKGYKIHTHAGASTHTHTHTHTHTLLKHHL